MHDGFRSISSVSYKYQFISLLDNFRCFLDSCYVINNLLWTNCSFEFSLPINIFVSMVFSLGLGIWNDLFIERSWFELVDIEVVIIINILLFFCFKKSNDNKKKKKINFIGRMTKWTQISNSRTQEIPFKIR